MADRVVREESRALMQRIAALESRQKVMGLRAWPGAVRTSQNLNYFTPPDPTVRTAMVSVDVPSGRWIVFGSVTAILGAVTATADIFMLTAAAFYQDTGTEVSATTFDAPPDYWSVPAGTSPPYYGGLKVMGDLIADRDVTVTIDIYSYFGTPLLMQRPRLRLLPV